MTSPGPVSPLGRALAVTVKGDKRISAVLEDAAREAGGRIRRLAGKDTISSAVRAAQLAQVRHELLKTSAAMWPEVEGELKKSLEDAAEAAAEAATYLDSVVFRSTLGAVPQGLAAAHRAQAKDTLAKYLARTANDIPLSTQVYKTSQLANGWVGKEIDRSLLLGESWKELADRVSGAIDPNVRGGVAYAAKRLARTEINNAFHTVQKEAHQDEPWVDTYKWNLSRSHTHVDECDRYATGVHFSGGKPGHFKKGDLPRKPHPQCMCHFTAETVDEDDFVNGFLKGDYDKYLDEKVYKYAPPSERPC